MTIEPIAPAVRIILVAQAICDCANAIMLKRFDEVDPYKQQIEWHILGLQSDCEYYFNDLMQKAEVLNER